MYAIEVTNGDPSLRNSTIEELKLKLENKEILVNSNRFDEEEEEDSTMIPDTLGNSRHHTSPPHLTDDGLIVPRKPNNPVRENTERQNLHKEFLFNQKIGKNVLNQKTELQRAMEKHKENLAKKQMESHLASQAHELEKVIADRQKKLQHKDNKADTNEDDKVINKEFLEARMKLKATSDLK